MDGLSPGLYSAPMFNLSHHSSTNQANRFYGYLVFASVLLALILTFWDSLDLQLARFFSRQRRPVPVNSGGCNR